jgi:phage FluMu protein Com
MSEATELRCRCHRLLARIDRARLLVVLRCPRCKREAVLSVAGHDADAELQVQLRAAASEGIKR